MTQHAQLTRRLPALLSILLSAAIILGAAGCGGRRSEQYRMEGDSYLQLGQYADAEKSYRKSLATVPDNAKASLGLARCLAAQEEFEEAVQQYTETVALEPSLTEAYLEGARLLLKLDRGDDALAFARQLEEMNKQAGGILRSSLLLKLGKSGDAVELLQSLRDEFPDSEEVRLNIASARLAMRQYEAAETELKGLIEELNPDSPPAHMLLIDVYRAQNKTDEMVAEIEQVMGLNPENAALRLALAKALLYTGRIDEAEDIANEALAADPASGWGNFIAGSCLLAREEYDAAVPFLQKAAQALPDKPEVARALDMALAPDSQTPLSTPSATADAGAAPKRTPMQDWPWEKLWQQAALDVLLGNRDAILASGDPLAKETVTAAALLLNLPALAEECASHLPGDSPWHDFLVALNEGNPEALNEALKSWDVAEDDEARAIIRDNAAAFAFALAGARARALQILTERQGTSPENAVALFNTAQIYRAAGMHEFAVKVVERLIAQYPENQSAHTLLYATLRRAGKLSDSRRAAEGAYTLFPETPAIVMNMAQACLDTKEPDMGRAVIERALKTNSQDDRLLHTLAGLEMTAGNLDAALKALDRISPEAPFGAALTERRMVIAALRKQWDTVKDLAAHIDDDTRSPLATLVLVSACLADGGKEAALAALTTPDSATPRAGRIGAIAATALGADAPGLNEEEQQLAGALAPNTEALRDFVLASACQGADLHDDAADLYEAANKEAGPSPLLARLMIANYAETVKTEDPGARAQAVAEQFPSHGAVWLSLATLYHTLEDEQGEGRALIQAVEAGPDNPEAWLRLGQFAEAHAVPDKAIDAYRKAIELRPGDPVSNNNLAYCLLTNGGDVQEALARAATAKEALPGNASIRHTLGLAQFRAGDLEEARKNLSIALELRPGDPTLLLDFGLLLIADGEEEMGKRHIEYAIQYADRLGLDFDRIDEALNALGRA